MFGQLISNGLDVAEGHSTGVRSAKQAFEPDLLLQVNPPLHILYVAARVMYRSFAAA